MSGGRRSGRTFGACAASLLGAVLWAVTLLSVLQWSTASAQPANLLEAPLPGGAATLAAPDGEGSGPIAYAQLPAAPAVAEKRASVSTGPSKGGPDDAAVDTVALPPPTQAGRGHTVTPTTARMPRPGAFRLPPTRAPPERA